MKSRRLSTTRVSHDPVADSVSRSSSEDDGGTSVWGTTGTICPCELSDTERAIMSELCHKRHLDNFYYEGALSLWMRAKAFYPCDSARLPELLLVALTLTLKYCGPIWTMHAATSIELAQEDWPAMTYSALLKEEMTMCQRLNWEFF